MKKITLLIIGLAIIAAFLLWFFFLSSSGTPATTRSGAPGFPVATSTATSFPITGTSTSTASGSDFLTSATTVADPLNPGYYYLGYHPFEGVKDPTATANPPYVIEYIQSTGYFNIALLQEPIGATRMAAEQFLMTDLGITEAQMCTLDYMVSVPAAVNDFYAGKDLGFSFCPGATALP